VLRFFCVKEPGKDKYPPQLVMDLLRLIGWVISKLCWFITYHGRDHIPDKRSGGFLIAANHQTYLDPVWICLPMRRRLRFMASDKAFEWRLIGPLIKYLGSFPVSAEVGGTLKAMKYALRALRDGAALTVFPEGGRQLADGQMLPFKTGAVRIAQQADVPILPVTITGGNRVWPRDQRYPRLFRRVEITYHPLVGLDQKTGNDGLEELTARLKETIEGTPDAIQG
jgi:1-acyl-sn-glycerol-3-phosphate acyltransferase